MKPAAATVASLAPIASLHRFDAYRLALAFRSHVVRWLALKRAELSDQLDRASLRDELGLAMTGVGCSRRLCGPDHSGMDHEVQTNRPSVLR